MAGKYGIGGLTRVAALDYASVGIRVNALAPGPILTDQLAAAGQGARSQVADAVPLGRIGRVDEVAAAAVWLCSGQSILVRLSGRALGACYSGGGRDWCVHRTRMCRTRL